MANAKKVSKLAVTTTSKVSKRAVQAKAKKVTAKAPAKVARTRTTLNRNGNIKFLVKACTSRAGTWRAKQWALLSKCKTVQQALTAGVWPGRLRKLVKAGSIAIA